VSPTRENVAKWIAQLAEADREDTVDGMLALELASRIASPVTTGSAVAALSRELTATMARALAGVKAKGDPIDEMAERRANRAAGQ
jgi:hypothetical protein